MMDRLLSALWVPVLVVFATTILIIGIGELLLALAHVQHELMGVKEPISVLVALLLATAILLGATWVARGKGRPGG